jgi:Cu(I)/Ag(I) efflux system membrane protein CusA/SilA
VAVVSLPLGILVAFTIMHWQGVNANIMSLGGIAIAIGAMTDGAIVMIENLHKHMAQTPLTKENRWQVVTKATQEVGPALFFSLLIITVSFLPVFMLEAQEGRLFSPLAYTKTFAMAASAALSITLIPVLMGYFIRGKVIKEEKNPLNRLLIWIYRPILGAALRFPLITIFIAILLTVGSIWPVSKISSEFMPTLDEGDLMYMPSSYPAISIGKAREILQQTDKLIKTVPEVDTVFGKIGRAETATDPAPLTMIETFIQFKPKSQWRAGLTREALQKELEQAIKIPSMSNVWVMPIKTRIDMLATGIKTPIGLTIAGDNLDTLEQLGKQIETLLTPMQGSSSVYAERTASGRYLNIQLKHAAIARLGLNTAEIQHFIAAAVGGKNVSNTIEGLARYPINVRYPQDYRQSPEALKELFFTASNAQVIRLGDVAHIVIEDGPAMIKSENARLTSTVLIDIKDISIKDYISNAQNLIDSEINLPVGYSLRWAGQFEYMERAKERLSYIIPLTLAIIVILLYLNFRRLSEVFMILSTLPLALVGGIWLMYFYNFKFSIGVGVGFIALAGVAIEIGVIMLVYLNQATEPLKNAKHNITQAMLINAIKQGAVLRIRPVMMTVATIILGLLPVLYGTGTGSEIMSRIAAPMVGGMISALVLTLLVLPCLYLLWHRRVYRN